MWHFGFETFPFLFSHLDPPANGQAVVFCFLDRIVRGLCCLFLKYHFYLWYRYRFRKFLVSKKYRYRFRQIWYWKGTQIFMIYSITLNLEQYEPWKVFLIKSSIFSQLDGSSKRRRIKLEEVMDIDHGKNYLNRERISHKCNQCE